MHGHSFFVTHKDGFEVKYPQEMDTLPILPGERYDIKVKMKNKGAWVFHDHITQHVTNGGFYPGGMLGVILYDDFEIPNSLKMMLSDIEKYNKMATEEMLPELEEEHGEEMMESMNLEGEME
jgi:hypothetical protein